MIQAGCHVVLQRIGGQHIKVCKVTSGGCIEMELEDEGDDVEIEGSFSAQEGSIESEKMLPNSEIETDMQENGSEDVSTSFLSPNQKMTSEQITRMKASGASTKQVVDKLVEGSTSFRHRTLHSKVKYLRKKSSKHSDQVLILRPTIRLIAESFYMKDSDRILGLRLDLLSHVLTLSGVHYGSSCIVFEQCCGLISAGVLERLGGSGTCVHIHRGLNAQSIPCVDSMDFSPEIYSTFMPLPVSYLLNDGDIPKLEEVDDPSDGFSQPSESILRKRERIRRETAVWDLLKRGQFKSLIIATKDVKPNEVLEKLWPFIDCSASIIVYSQAHEHVTLTYNWLKANNAVNVEVHDAFYRSYFVSPENTRPNMQQLITGGIILSAIKVLQFE